MKDFNFYEFAGILVPGTIVVLGARSIFPELAVAIPQSDGGFDELGVFLVVAYAGGHLVQAIAHIFENLWWKVNGGMPSDWIRSGNRQLLAPAQVQRIIALVRDNLRLPDFDLSKATAREWYAVTRQMYAQIELAGKNERAETFNGNYGLNRGTAVSLIAVAAMTIAHDPSRYWFCTILVGLALLAFSRMHRFGEHYARELFVKYLQMEKPQ